MQAEIRFRAMGTSAHILTAGLQDHHLDRARAIVVECEQRWSRFLPGSELSELNAAAGSWTPVSPETFALVDAAIAGWHMTAGRFDPTILNALVEAGYDRTFELVERRPTARQRRTATLPTSAGCGDIELDPDGPGIRLPAGVGFDLGGIAKGHTADLVVEELLRLGATGVVANIGGDVRVAGCAPTGRAWRVAVEDPLGGEPLAVCAIGDGAVATTTRRRRAWMTPTGPAHHLIDPATGLPSASDLLAVSVVACRGIWAEVLAKAAFVAGRKNAFTVLAEAGTTGILVDERGQATNLPGMSAFLS